MTKPRVQLPETSRGHGIDFGVQRFDFPELLKRPPIRRQDFVAIQAISRKVALGVVSGYFHQAMRNYYSTTMDTESLTLWQVFDARLPCEAGLRKVLGPV